MAMSIQLREQTNLRPRLALCMAMVVLFFATTGGSFNPAKILCDAHCQALRVKDQAVQTYESIRFVYQLERRLKDLRDRQQAHDR